MWKECEYHSNHIDDAEKSKSCQALVLCDPPLLSGHSSLLYAPGPAGFVLMYSKITFASNPKRLANQVYPSM